MILPSHSEGLPFAILEAWAAGTPTIMTSECNLPEGFAEGAALECGFDAAAIAQAMAQALSLNGTDWLRMAQAAQRLAAGPFSANAIAIQWAETYQLAMAHGTANAD